MGDRVGPLPCFKCKVELEPVNGDGVDPHQPYAGTLFSTSGHYGSTFVDFLSNSSYIEILVCDECLRANPLLIERVDIKRSYEYYRGPYDSLED